MREEATYKQWPMVLGISINIFFNYIVTEHSANSTRATLHSKRRKLKGNS